MKVHDSAGGKSPAPSDFETDPQRLARFREISKSVAENVVARVGQRSTKPKPKSNSVPLIMGLGSVPLFFTGPIAMLMGATAVVLGVMRLFAFSSTGRVRMLGLLSAGTGAVGGVLGLAFTFGVAAALVKPNQFPMTSNFGDTAHQGSAAETKLPGKSIVVSTTNIVGTDGNPVETVYVGAELVVLRKAGDRLFVWHMRKPGWIAANRVVDADKAMRYFSGRLAKSEEVEAYVGRGLLHLRGGNRVQATADFRDALRIGPEDPGAVGANLVMKCLAAGLDYEGKNADVLVNELESVPDGYRYLLRLPVEIFGVLLPVKDEVIALKRPPSIILAEAALKRHPDCAAAHFQLAEALHGKKEIALAASTYESGLAIMPWHKDSLNGLAWLYATSLSGAIEMVGALVELAKKACELSGWEDPNIIDTLAAALAEAGDFPKAVQYQKLAIKGLNGTPNTQLEQHLELFQSGSPVRE